MKELCADYRVRQQLQHWSERVEEWRDNFLASMRNICYTLKEMKDTAKGFSRELMVVKNKQNLNGGLNLNLNQNQNQIKSEAQNIEVWKSIIEELYEWAFGKAMQEIAVIKEMWTLLQKNADELHHEWRENIRNSYIKMTEGKEEKLSTLLEANVENCKKAMKWGQLAIGSLIGLVAGALIAGLVASGAIVAVGAAVGASVGCFGSSGVKKLHNWSKECEEERLHQEIEQLKMCCQNMEGLTGDLNYIAGNSTLMEAKLVEFDEKRQSIVSGLRAIYQGLKDHQTTSRMDVYITMFRNGVDEYANSLLEFHQKCDEAEQKFKDIWFASLQCEGVIE